MNYLVLYLFPSIVQVFVTFVIFYSKFKSPELSAIAFLSFVAYCVATILLTQWRKKFRKATNRSDNKYHDLATDSLVNFETVKYFANEAYEIERFKKAVVEYQKYNVATQASLALLNVTQQMDVQITMMIALCVSATTILHTLDPTKSIGEFVSVNSYITTLFTPLSFLGTIYSTVIQAFIDMANLAELLTKQPDVKDPPSAATLRVKDAARIEFRNVHFSYPSQPSKGLRDVSFVVEPGTTTAIVGQTGAGKSTIGRLLFRFYDVSGGSILINGQNIASVKQTSLRSCIGVVPQDTVLFNSSIKSNVSYGKVGAPFEKEARSGRCAAHALYRVPRRRLGKHGR